MADRRDDWVEIFQALGESFLAVLKSEWEVLADSWWNATAKRLLFAAAFFLAAGLLLFYLTGVAVAAAVLILDIWWQPWQAALIVAAALLLAVLALAGVGYFAYLRRFKNPVETAKQRFADHMDWWRGRLLEGESLAKTLPEGDNDDEASSTSRPGTAREPSPGS